MKNKKQFRQGDILIEGVESVPNGSDAKEKGRAILAHGEVTGHCHEVDKPQFAALRKPESEMRLMGDLPGAESMTVLALTTTRKSAVKHQEHSKIELPKGNYRVLRQREYSPEAIRNVAD